MARQPSPLLRRRKSGGRRKRGLLCRRRCKGGNHPSPLNPLLSSFTGRRSRARSTYAYVSFSPQSSPSHFLAEKVRWAGALPPATDEVIREGGREGGEGGAHFLHNNPRPRQQMRKCESGRGAAVSAVQFVGGSLRRVKREVCNYLPLSLTPSSDGVIRCEFGLPCDIGEDEIKVHVAREDECGFCM